ncbi:hypothetical protein K461DRAFT_277267 [Myriangium duriaei CBS 260.36]|uniref:Trichothecene 3-O-acetyltransferase-like N-terminal domain-containing protein n=1 Tax=Myriangium duriaei CBS 260.36 TaxID=1168546 RepID=A0A9P4MLF9_9PEZI|nr:hypothetical protein K461DRAFT_277267 [Myriangium duriaei CBS 260.36]
MASLDFSLDVFAELAGMHGLYTQVSLFYALPPAADLTTLSAHITSTLTTGLRRLASSFPWTAGQVVRLHNPDAWGRHFRIRPLDPSPRLVVRDLRHDEGTSSLATLREAGFPFSLLGEEWLAPCSTLAFDLPEKPVLMVQANLLRDGVVVTVNTEHQVMDFVGQGAVMALLDKACRGVEFSAEEVELGNRERRNMTPLLDEDVEAGPGLTYQFRPEQSSVQHEPETVIDDTQAECEWGYFNVSATSLVALKEKVTSQLKEGYVSTDDCLSALLWQCVLRARHPRLRNRQETTIARAVDARRYVGVVKSYPGFLQNMAYATAPIEKLINAPLGHVAAILRGKVDPATSGMGMATRELATALHRTSAQEREKIGVTATLKLDVDLMPSSWASVDCYAFDFGLGFGKPEQVKRPRLAEVEGLTYFMPRNPDGDGAVGIALRKEDMLRLREDKDWCTYANYVG